MAKCLSKEGMLFFVLSYFLNSFLNVYVIYINAYRHERAIDALKVVYDEVLDDSEIKHEVRKKYADKFKIVFENTDDIFLSDDHS